MRTGHTAFFIATLSELRDLINKYHTTKKNNNTIMPTAKIKLTSKERTMIEDIMDIAEEEMQYWRGHSRADLLPKLTALFMDILPEELEEIPEEEQDDEDAYDD